MLSNMESDSRRLHAEAADPVKTTFRALLLFHLHDWLALLALAVLYGVLMIIHPFYRFVGRFDIDDFRFPLKSDTIPFAVVPVIAIVIPLVFIVVYFIYKRDLQDLHHAILGLLFSVLIAAVITDAIKNACGRPRPDFFWRCFPNGNAIYDSVTQQVQCTGRKADIKEGHKSFPSGHTSWAFAGLGYLSLYLAGKLELFNRRAHLGKLVIVFLPLLGAALVGVSRVDDYKHHWQDVFASGLLGLSIAAICYHQQFPWLHHPNSFHAYPFKGIAGAHWNNMPQNQSPNMIGSPLGQYSGSHREIPRV
ncbi:hypothetical protein O6H91_07G050900 [Diphasiastrum complanatum]|uniref:Uncharacterized protein n=2 Tax=Diphasiastrum complanatum TaxID=34168 RepID=A0ACC2D548_DIPCM|nr:hypothetical protein O6H91_Y236800 [Diphasiastrum complanatum]KAJ7299398.1 hypothetical protein O6H91_Y236800 [Diphasiastrum complanatum]KAJ7549371.1 hypothetical protein O6H91_07G050900 [Diphasiastrum complanatum]KAJ7549372.1 hypothetical protein O6H91_07G050900 [Diphasiastrum complanatum]